MDPCQNHCLAVPDSELTKCYVRSKESLESSVVPSCNNLPVSIADMDSATSPPLMPWHEGTKGLIVSTRMFWTGHTIDLQSGRLKSINLTPWP